MATIKGARVSSLGREQKTPRVFHGLLQKTEDIVKACGDAKLGDDYNMIDVQLTIAPEVPLRELNDSCRREDFGAEYLVDIEKFEMYPGYEKARNPVFKGQVTAIYRSAPPPQPQAVSEPSQAV